MERDGRSRPSSARSDLLSEGKPVFIIAGHYGTTSLLTFYIPEAQAGVPDDPLVYCLSSDEPKNQFYFWPGYETRKGQNAIYIAPVDRARTSAACAVAERVRLSDRSGHARYSLQRPCLSPHPALCLPRSPIRPIRRAPDTVRGRRLRPGTNPALRAGVSLDVPDWGLGRGCGLALGSAVRIEGRHRMRDCRTDFELGLAGSLPANPR